MLPKFRLLILFCLFSMFSYSQVETRVAAWSSIISTYNLKGKWGLNFDFILRSTDHFEYVQTVMVKPGVNYRFNKTVTAFLGYNNIRSRVGIGTVSGYTTEHQVWQQLFIRHKLFNRINTLHRPLFEQRFISRAIVKNNAIETDGRQFALRLRYLFRNQLPFKKQPTFTKGGYAFTQQEILLNLGDKSAVNGKTYDQFRVLSGLGYRFSPKLDLEGGYLFRDVSTKTSLHYHDHIIQLSSFIRL